MRIGVTVEQAKIHLEFVGRAAGQITYVLPINRLISKKVFSGLRAAWFLAASPTSLSPFSEKAT